jgi:hypothetical protein
VMSQRCQDQEQSFSAFGLTSGCEIALNRASANAIGCDVLNTGRRNLARSRMINRTAFYCGLFVICQST